MQRYFVADIHLCEAKPAITTAFINFLHQLPDESELYILGDLFDYWIGDDSLLPIHHVIAQAFQEISRRKVAIFFMDGNRDFLLGQQYAKRCQMQILPQIHSLQTGSQTVVLLHGDLLCTDDHAYQRFRRFTHCQMMQKLFLLLPLKWRLKVAGRLRNESQQANQSKAEQIMDVNQQAVEALFERTNADIMIHGHTHKPAMHPVPLAQKMAYRYVLGAWHDRRDYVVMHGNSLALRSFDE